MFEQLILICDVDGVIRESVEGHADPQVVAAIKSLLSNENVEVVFISGTPVDNNLNVAPWCRGNLPLNKVFGETFAEEIANGRVNVYGVLGGQKMNPDGSFECMDSYSQNVSSEICGLLVEAFLREVAVSGEPGQKAKAEELLVDLREPQLNSTRIAEHQGFQEVIGRIRSAFDPEFRLVDNGSLIETQTSNPAWGVAFSCKWLKNEINQPKYNISFLLDEQKQIAAGLAMRGEEGFNFLQISKINKGAATHRLLKDKLVRFPNALVVTVGDTQVDYPMHNNAHLAFHVGLEKVWIDNPLPHCCMVRNSRGEDKQHIEGTLQVLRFLQKTVDESFKDINSGLLLPSLQSVHE